MAYQLLQQKKALLWELENYLTIRIPKFDRDSHALQTTGSHFEFVVRNIEGVFNGETVSGGFCGGDDDREYCKDGDKGKPHGCTASCSWVLELVAGGVEWF